MKISVSPTKSELGQQAAARGAESIRQALDAKGVANIIVATGASQFETIAALVQQPDIDWSRITIFHLDEYAGIGEEHPASFRRYLRERLLAKLPMAPAAFHPVNGEGDLEAECARLNELIAAAPIDVAFVGIGENAHLAFNDPPANFETRKPFIVVNLDEDCRRQQWNEGWFETLEDVPTCAISMSIRQILASKFLIVSVPDERKARAVKSSVEGDVSNMAPASILQTHSNTTLFLDTASASLLHNDRV